MEPWSHSNVQSENNTLGVVRYIGKIVLGTFNLIDFIVTIVILGGKKLSWKLKWIATFGNFSSCGNGKVLYILLGKKASYRDFWSPAETAIISETKK